MMMSETLNALKGASKLLGELSPDGLVKKTVDTAIAKAMLADAGGLSIVHVRWRDSVVHNGWAPVDWILSDEIIPADTVGVLLRESDVCVVLAMTVGGVQVGDVLKIPRGMIDSMVVLGSISAKLADLPD